LLQSSFVIVYLLIFYITKHPNIFIL
jgi:hypothetical protein